jgi:hypothetical protein
LRLSSRLLELRPEDPKKPRFDVSFFGTSHPFAAI